MRFAFMIIASLVACESVTAQVCKKGKPCGNTCIAQDKVCHVGAGTARAAGSPPAAVPVPDSVQWIGWREAKLYFRARCIPASTVPLTERVYFKAEQEAKDSGFKRSKGDMDCKGQ